VREFSEKQKKELKKTLDTVGVVRDFAFTEQQSDIDLSLSHPALFAFLEIVYFAAFSGCDG